MWPLLQASAQSYELVLVNDGSHDHTWGVILPAGTTIQVDPGINLTRNYGQHNALFCGILAAKHEVIVTMDDDLQHLPEEIPKLLDKLAEGTI